MAKRKTKERDRQELLRRGAAIRDEIEQIFLDAASWNENHPREEPIDPDPKGELRRIHDTLDALPAPRARVAC